MNLGQIFNRDEMPTNTNNFEPIPAGWYTAHIAKAEVRATRDGTGNYINMQLSITGPSYEGRVVFGTINLRNKSQKAEEIGRAQLGDLMRALGLARVQDTDELVGGHVSIKVAVETSEGYEPRNTVKAYKAIDGSAPPAPSKPAIGGQTPATGGSTPPWVKRS